MFQRFEPSVFTPLVEQVSIDRIPKNLHVVDKSSAADLAGVDASGLEGLARLLQRAEGTELDAGDYSALHALTRISSDTSE